MTLTTHRTWLIVSLVAACLSWAVVDLAAEQAAPGAIQGNAEQGTRAEATNKNEFRKREGAAFSSEGYVQFTGERLTFISEDGQERLVLLENLALDRLSRTIRDTNLKTRWKVFGTITEYQGSNFLFLNRAVLVHRDDELGD